MRFVFVVCIIYRSISSRGVSLARESHLMKQPTFEHGIFVRFITGEQRDSIEKQLLFLFKTANAS